MFTIKSTKNSNERNECMYTFSRKAYRASKLEPLFVVHTIIQKRTRAKNQPHSDDGNHKKTRELKKWQNLKFSAQISDVSCM